MASLAVKNSVVSSLVQAKWKIEQAVERLEFALDELDGEEADAVRLMKYRIEEAKQHLVAYIDLEGRGPGLIDTLIETAYSALATEPDLSSSHSVAAREGI